MSARCTATAAVRAGIDADTAHGAVVPPIVLSSNFSFEGFERKRKYDYTRSGNPTRDQLAEALAELEGGAGAVITATGMARVWWVQFFNSQDALILNTIEVTEVPSVARAAAEDIEDSRERLTEVLEWIG